MGRLLFGFVSPVLALFTQKTWHPHNATVDRWFPEVIRYSAGFFGNRTRPECQSRGELPVIP